MGLPRNEKDFIFSPEKIMRDICDEFTYSIKRHIVLEK